MPSKHPKFFNKSFILALSIGIVGLCTYLIIGFLGFRINPNKIFMIILFIMIGLAFMTSGVFWVKLYAEHPSGVFCSSCGYDMQVQTGDDPTCPECGKSRTSEYRQTGWRDTAKQLPGCLFFILGSLFLFIGCLVIFLLNNGGFE